MPDSAVARLIAHLDGLDSADARPEGVRRVGREGRRILIAHRPQRGRRPAPSATDPCFLCDRQPLVGRIEPLGARLNAYPVFPRHLVLAPDRHRDHPIAADIDAMAALLRSAARPSIGWMNGPGSGASHPAHQHYQVCLGVPELGDMLIACAGREVVPMGARGSPPWLATLVDYPLPGLALRGTALGRRVIDILAAWRPTACNLVFLPDEVVIFPRARARPSRLPSRGFGGLELAGCLVLESVEPLAVTLGEALAGLTECGVSAEHFAALMRALEPLAQAWCAR